MTGVVLPRSVRFAERIEKRLMARALACLSRTGAAKLDRLYLSYDPLALRAQITKDGKSVLYVKRVAMGGKVKPYLAFRRAA